jgi:hypothetical protein
MEMINIMQFYLKVFKVNLQEIFFSFKNNFSENVIDIVNKLKDEVKIFNEDNEYYECVFDFSQPLTNLYEEIIIIIDYTNKIIQINIPKIIQIIISYFLQNFKHLYHLNLKNFKTN